MLAPAPAALVAAAVGEPGGPAILIDDDVVSYAELDERVGRMARALADRGARPGTFVTLLLPRCADLIVAMHAVLRPGAAYIPLDPTHPIDRITYALDDSEPVLVVTTSDIATRLPGLPCLPVDTTGFPARRCLSRPSVPRMPPTRSTRVEPGEIAAVIGRDPAVEQVVVLAREDRLVAYVTPDGIDTDRLRAAVSALLPEHMLPAAFVPLPGRSIRSRRRHQPPTGSPS